MTMSVEDALILRVYLTTLFNFLIWFPRLNQQRRFGDILDDGLTLSLDAAKS